MIGGCFYLMEFVDGWSPIQEGSAWPAPFGTDLEARRGLAFQLVDGIARLSRVDWEARGLEGFGKPDGFHERQVDRWLGHLAAVQFRPLPGLDEAAAWLRTHQPRTYRPGIMHGDYQFANVMFRHGAPARLAAIVDWEMATVGDLCSISGWVVNGWPDDTSPAGAGTVSYVDYTGMPSEARAARLLRHRERPAGGRDRLLRDPGPLQAGRRPRRRATPGWSRARPTTPRWTCSATSCSRWRRRRPSWPTTTATALIVEGGVRRG